MRDAAGAARSLVDRYWEGLLEIDPILSTEVGDERFDDRLPDPSEAGRAERESLHSGALAELREIPAGELDLVLRTSLDVLSATARRVLNDLRFRTDRLSAVTHMFGPTQLLADLGSVQRVDTPERLDRYVRRLSAIPEYLRASAENARDGAAVGVTVPRVVIERTIAQTERLLAIPADRTPALQPVREGAGADAKPRVIDVVREEVMPAYERYLEFLREYAPSATETIGLYALPDGEAMYAAQVLAWTTLPLAPQAAHDLGVEDLAAIQEERQEIAEGLGFPEVGKAIEAYNASATGFARSREEIVGRAEEQVQRGWDAAPRFFGRLPKENCQVRPVEEFREADMPFAFYLAPSEDGSRPGLYYVNAYDLPNRPLLHLATTTYHEANPGHHLQIAIEQEMSDRPALRRFGGGLAGSAFVEGWGLYSERLADEMGLFLDEYERLGMLDAQAHRAARLIVDTGIHALAWDRGRSISQLEEAGVPHIDAVIETDRYITWPGQALSYKIGQLEIQKWRRTAEARDGGMFSLKAFHDRLLELGQLPLHALQREIQGARD